MTDFIVKTLPLLASNVDFTAIENTVEDLVDGGKDVDIQVDDIQATTGTVDTLASTTGTVATLSSTALTATTATVTSLVVTGATYETNPVAFTTTRSCTSTSATDVTLATISLADVTSYLIVADVIAKLAANAAVCGSFRTSVIAYRQATAAAIIDESVSQTNVSGLFKGLWQWTTSTNDVVLNVNSGAAATTYYWKANISVISIIDP